MKTTKLLLVSAVIYSIIITIIAFEYASRVGAYNTLLETIEYVPSSVKEYNLLDKAEFFNTEYGNSIFNDTVGETDWGIDYLNRKGY